MTYTFTDGSITVNSSEQTLVDLIADEEFAMWIFLHNMTSSETFRIKVYVRDQNGGSLRLYETEDHAGVQSEPALYISPILTKEFKVTIQKTLGTDRVVTWQTIEVT